MEIQSKRIENENILQVFLIGSLDETNSIAFADRLINSIVGKLAPVISLNFSKCNQICTSGIGALVSFCLSPELEGHVIEISGQSEALEEKMRNLKLDRLFRFAPRDSDPEKSNSTNTEDLQA